MNVAGLAERYGIERLGFLTLTFADHVTDPKEAQRRFKSLRTGVLAERYDGFVRVFERQKSGRIHYHLIVVAKDDIRSGVDFAAFARRDYRTASPYLRTEWAFLRSTAKAYGFGRTELMPIRSTQEGIARYVGKYISKHIDQREERDKGVRLADYSRGARIANTRFSWASPGARQWRLKLALFAQMMFQARRIPSPTFQGLRAGLCQKWAYHWKDFILSLPDIEDTHAPSDQPRSSLRVVPAELVAAADPNMQFRYRDQLPPVPQARRVRGEDLESDWDGHRGGTLAGDDFGQRDAGLPDGLDAESHFYDFARRRIVSRSALTPDRPPARLASINYNDGPSSRLSPPS